MRQSRSCRQCQLLDVDPIGFHRCTGRCPDNAWRRGRIIHTVGLSPQMADVGAHHRCRPGWHDRTCWNKRAPATLRRRLCRRIASMSAYMVPPNEEIDRALADPAGRDFSHGLNALTRAGGTAWKTRAWPTPTPRRRSRNTWQSGHQPGAKKASASSPFLRD